MSAQPVPQFTHEEYIEHEVQSNFRHEYKQGRVEMMAGGSRKHSLLITKAVRLLDTALDGRDCEVHSEAMLVHIASANISTYPDTMVICGKPNFLDRRENIVTNPIVVVEVVSPSTENYDRNEKFRAYQQLESLKEYVLISQNEPLVEVFARTDSGPWIRTEYRGLETSVRLESLAVEIPLHKLYEKVDWSQ